LAVQVVNASGDDESMLQGIFAFSPLLGSLERKKLIL